MPVAGRSLRPSRASLARWFLRFAILAPRRNHTPAPGHGQPLAHRAWVAFLCPVALIHVTATRCGAATNEPAESDRDQKKPPRGAASRKPTSAPSWTRTKNPLIKSQML